MSPAGPGKDLTPRELELLGLYAQGFGTKDIAQKLSLAVTTVETHKFNIFTRLGAHSTLEMITIGIRRKLIPCPFCLKKEE